MLKLSALASVLAATLFFSTGAQAQPYTYLGGALNLGHCQQLAGAAGYQLATFGGYVNGIYYWNACFGSNLDNGEDDRTQEFDVYVRRGYNDSDCADDIEYELRGVRCLTETRGLLSCRSYRGADRRDIESVRCVDEAYRR